MTDILDWLRDNDTDWLPSDIQNQRRLAADEIDRLQTVARDNQKLAAARGIEIERLRAALEMIAGERPCADNLLGNFDIAYHALHGKKT